MNLNNYLKITPYLRFQLSGEYESDEITIQGVEKSGFTANGGLRADLLKNTLSISLTAKDIFSTSKSIVITDIDGLYQFSKKKPQTPIISLSVSYTFNNFKFKRKSELVDDFM